MAKKGEMRRSRGETVEGEDTVNAGMKAVDDDNFNKLSGLPDRGMLYG